MLKLILPTVLALTAGASVVIQQVLNANLRSALNSAVWSGFAATSIALLVTGQMLASVALDHFGLFGLVQRSIDRPGVIGVILLIGGVVLIRR